LKRLSITALAAAFLSSTSAFAATMGFDVHANTHVWNDGVGYAGNLGLQTGLNFAAGEAFSVAVDDVNDTWNFCVGGSISSCEVDADGVRPASNTILGGYSSAGASFAYGTLVGRVGTGSFFAIGTAGFSGTADVAGELSLFHWDHNTNNGGTIAATVTYSQVAPVPLPAGLPLLALGLGGFAIAAKRKRKD
jgi:hypothetical protein